MLKMEGRSSGLIWINELMLKTEKNADDLKCIR